jgi:hypothetical protein
VFNGTTTGVEGGLTLEKRNLEKLLSAAPALELHADVLLGCDAAQEEVILQKPPFERLHMRVLCLGMSRRDDVASVVGLASAVASHTSLTGVRWVDAPLDTAAALDAVVDAALARNMYLLGLFRCTLSSAVAAPALARLVRGGALATLRISNVAAPFDAPGAALLGDALRESSAITSIDLSGVIWHQVDAVITLLHAVTGHSSVRELIVDDGRSIGHAAAALGAALGALVAADAPALRMLALGRLRNAALRPLLDALPRNTHLRTLTFCGAYMIDQLVRDTLLPAVRANSSLRELRITEFTEYATATLARDAELLVALRAAADA